LLPASTVPRSVGLAREGETAFPREVPAEASRPRSVPQVSEPNESGSVPCGFRALPCGRPRFPGGIRFVSVLRHRHLGSLSDSDKAELPRCPFAKPSARGLPVSPDPRRKVGSALACAAASRFFLPVARTTLRLASVRRLPPLSAGPSLRASLRFRKAAPCDKPVSGRDLRVAPNAIWGSRPVDNGDNGDNAG
jgi:hypothetical protein